MGRALALKPRSAVANGETAEGLRKEILDAAAAAFMQKGYAATSIDDVAALLGATKGRVYHHFRSKTDLFFEVHKQAMAMDLQAVRDSMQGLASPIARLHAMARAHLLVVMREIAYQCVVVQGLEMHQAGQTTALQRKTLRDILALRDDYETLFAEQIAAAVAAGEIPAQDVRVVVKAFLGSLNWTTIWYRPRRAQGDGEREALAGAIADFVVRGLGAALPSLETGGGDGR